MQHILAIKPESAQDFIGASRSALQYKVNFQEARDFAEQAIELDAKDWHAHEALADALFYAALLERKEGKAADLLSQSIAAYEQAAEVGRFTKLRKKRTAGNFPLVQMHNAWATAHIYAGNYETAFEMLDNLLDVDETSSGTYRALALMQIIASNSNVVDLGQAAEDLKAADDFGLAPANLAVRAMLEQAKGNAGASQAALKQAVAADRFGIGRALFPILVKKAE